jgi:hypothetical protein
MESPGPRPVFESSRDLLVGMRDAFEQAERQAADAICERNLLLGGRRVRMRIVGPDLFRRLSAAVSHLPDASTDREPDLTVELWDGESTGVDIPISNLRDAFHRTWPFGRSVLASSRDESTIGYQSFGSSLIYDRRERAIVGRFDSHARLTLFEMGKPLQPLLFAWHSDNDAVPVHAGFVAREGRGVLMGGSGGSGKSTTCLLCLEHGFDYLGDDYIGIPDPGNSAFAGFSFYNSTWLDPKHIGRLPWLAPHGITGGPRDDKQLVLLGELYPDRMTDRAEICAILLPRVSGIPETRWRPALPAEAILRLAPSSILQLPFVSAQRSLSRIAELAARVPAYWLEVGTDFAQIPRAVAEILHSEAS